MVLRSTDSEGRVTEVAPFMKQGMNFLNAFSGGSPQKKALNEAGFSKVNEDELLPLFDYLEIICIIVHILHIIF